MGAAVLYTTIDLCKIRVGQYGIVDFYADALLFQRLGGLRDDAELYQHLVGNHQNTFVAEAHDCLTQSRRASSPDKHQRCWQRNKLHQNTTQQGH